MKEKVLTLCRRLKKCTLNDLVSYLEIKSCEIEPILLQLEDEGCIKRNEGEILYLGKNTVSKGKIEKKDIREFKITYSFLTRVESHNVNENYMYYRLAEYIWRRNKDYKTLYKDLTNLINNQQLLSGNEPTGVYSGG